MRVQDAEDAIYDGLRALEWFRYLSAMWIISGEIWELYAERLTGPERSLLADSLAAIRAAALEREVTEGMASAASTLASAWEAMIPAQTAPPEHMGTLAPGHWNARVVLADLMGEIAGTCDRYAGAERVDNAATMRFDEESRSGNHPVRRRPGGEIDDASPKAQMLSRIEAVVTGMARLPDDDDRDPLQLRARLLGP